MYFKVTNTTYLWLYVLDSITIWNDTLHRFEICCKSNIPMKGPMDSSLVSYSKRNFSPAPTNQTCFRKWVPYSWFCMDTHKLCSKQVIWIWISNPQYIVTGNLDFQQAVSISMKFT